MDWTIYSFGATKYLEQVFNAIAMYSNSGNFDGMFRVALGIGIVIIIVQCILDGGQTIKFQMPAIAIVIYMAMFSATTRVQIEDSYTGRATAVDNVPYGVAVIGSIISTVGHSITEGMEQAFSTPGMTTYGMIDPLVTIASAKDVFSSPMTLAVMSDGNLTVDISESIKNYLNDCTMNSILDGSQTLDKIYSSPSGIDSLATQNAGIYTKIYDGLGTNSTAYNPSRASLLTCDNAWAKIKTMLRTNEVKAWNLAACRDSSTQSDNESVSVTCASGGATVKAKVDNAINYLGLLGQSSSDLQQMMILGPFLDRAVIRKENSVFQDASAIQRANALDQQNVALAGKGSSFLTWAQPMMTFIQGMIFGITPFMVFVLGLGLMGIRLIGKYFLVLVWVQLWYPILAIINMYVITRTTENLAMINTQGLSFDTLAEALRTITMDAGLAGNLIAATPVLAGFIVWGSAQAFTSMTSQFSSAQGVDPKTLSPDLTSPAPVIAQAPSYQADKASGVRATGTDVAAGTLNSSQTLGASISSSSARARSAQESLSSEVSSVYQRAFQAANSVGKGSQFSEAYNNNLSRVVGGGSSSTAGVTAGSTSGHADRSSTSSRQSQTLGGGAQAGVNAMGVGAGVKADVSSSTSGGNDTSNDLSLSRGYTEGRSSTDSTSVQNATSEQKAAALLETLNQTSSYTAGAASSEGIKRALAESRVASEEFRAVEQLSSTQGTGYQMPMLQAARISLGMNGDTTQAEREGRMATMQQMLEGKRTNDGEHLKEYVGRTTERLMEQDPSLNHETAFGVAAITGLSKAGKLGEFLSSSISPINAGGRQVDASKNESIDGPGQHAINNLHTRADNVEGGVRSNIDSGAGSVSQNPSSTFAGNRDRVQSATRDGETASRAYGQQSMGAVQGEINAAAASSIKDASNGRGNNDSFSKNHAHVLQMAQNAISSLVSNNGDDAQTKNFLAHYSHAMESGVTSAQAALYAASKADFGENTDLGRTLYANAYQDAMLLSGNDDKYARGVIATMRDSVRGTSGVDSDQRLEQLRNANNHMRVEGYDQSKFSVDPHEVANKPAFGGSSDLKSQTVNGDVPIVEGMSQWTGTPTKQQSQRDDVVNGDVPLVESNHKP